MISRIFANALARRLAAVIVAGALVWMGIDSAHAQAANVADFGSEGAAFAACEADTQAELAYRRSIDQTYNYATYGCRHSTGAGVSQTGGQPYFMCSVYRTFSGTEFYCQKNTKFYYRYPKDQTCSKMAPYTGSGPWSSVGGSASNGSLGCRDGCDGMWNRVGDSSMTFTPTGGLCPSDEKANCARMPGYYWNALLKVCEPVEIECPEGQAKINGSCAEACPPGMVVQSDGTCKAKESECPAGNVKAPSGQCLPGEGQCAAGEAKGKDGTCKRDADGDGKPDAGEEEGTTDETFAGGDSCNAPPACSGSAILCGQARIQWRIDCNTRKNRNISGGACAAMPICTGEKCDALEYSGLLMQWRTACATEKLAGKGNGNGDGSQPEWTKVGGMNQDPGAGQQSGDAPKVHEKKVSTDDLDQSGFGGGSCVGFGGGGGSGVSSGFLQTLASPPPLWCNYIGALKAVFILIGAVVSVFILSKGA